MIFILDEVSGKNVDLWIFLRTHVDMSKYFRNQNYYFCKFFCSLLISLFFFFLSHYCCILKVEPDSRRIFSKKFTFTVVATSCHPKYLLFYILKKQFSLFIISNRRFDSATTNRLYFCFFITLFLSTYSKIYNEWACKAKW